MFLQCSPYRTSGDQCGKESYEQCGKESYEPFGDDLRAHQNILRIFSPVIF